MPGSIRRAIEFEDPAALENATDDDISEVVIVEDGAPTLGGQEHRFAFLVPLVDDVEQDVGSVGAIGEVADSSMTRRALDEAVVFLVAAHGNVDVHAICR